MQNVFSYSALTLLNVMAYIVMRESSARVHQVAILIEWNALAWGQDNTEWDQPRDRDERRARASEHRNQIAKPCY